MTMIRTESGLIALRVGTRVIDRTGDKWVREEREHEWNGMDAPYPVLVLTSYDYRNEVEYLDDNPYQPTTVALDYGPFEIEEVE